MWSCSNTLCMYDMDVGCSLKGSTALTITKRHGVYTYITLDFSQELSQIWGNVCGGNGKSVQPYTHPQQLKLLKTPHVCMAWMWDAFWKVLQPQQLHSSMVCTLSSPRIWPNSPKSGEMSVVRMVWVCSHITIHNIWSCSNTLCMYDMDAGCSLTGSTASTMSYQHGLQTWLESTRILANSPKSGEMLAMLTVWVCSH